MFQEVFNNILSNLEYDNINYDVVTECGKTVIKIKCENGKIGKIIFDDTEENNDCLQCNWFSYGWRLGNIS